jgi:dCMP deaminase
MMQDKWDRRFLDLAKLVASWSKDPSTQTGAVIVDCRRRVVSCGYNGFARGVDDQSERYADRQTKYRMVVHCEVNAILFAGRPVAGCTLYTWPFASCAPCAAQVIQSGIVRCVAPVVPQELAERWATDLELARSMFAESGVVLVEIAAR